jgi:hypothetical protein
MKLIDEKDLWVGAMKLMHGPENQAAATFSEIVVGRRRGQESKRWHIRNPGPDAC